MPVLVQDLICLRAWTFSFSDSFSARYSGVIFHLLGSFWALWAGVVCGLPYEEGAEVSVGPSFVLVVSLPLSVAFAMVKKAEGAVVYGEGLVHPCPRWGSC